MKDTVLDDTTKLNIFTVTNKAQNTFLLGSPVRWYRPLLHALSDCVHLTCPVGHSKLIYNDLFKIIWILPYTESNEGTFSMKMQKAFYMFAE